MHREYARRPGERLIGRIHSRFLISNNVGTRLNLQRVRIICRAVPRGPHPSNESCYLSASQPVSHRWARYVVSSSAIGEKLRGLL